MIYFEPLSTKLHWEWVHARAFPILCADSCGIVAVRDTGQILAAVVFDSFTQSACNAHIAIDNPIVLRNGFLQAAAEEVFIRRNRKRIFGLTPENNKRALKFNERIGWKRVAVIPDAFDDGIGYVISRMDRDTTPWLNHLREAA